MTEPKRVDLAGELAGRHVLLDLEQVDVGLIEDLSSRNVTMMLDAFARLIVGGDLPHGTDRVGLRRLKLQQMKALGDGIDSVISIPNAT